MANIIFARGATAVMMSTEMNVLPDGGKFHNYMGIRRILLFLSYVQTVC